VETLDPSELLACQSATPLRQKLLDLTGLHQKSNDHHALRAATALQGIGLIHQGDKLGPAQAAELTSRTCLNSQSSERSVLRHQAWISDAAKATCLVRFSLVIKGDWFEHHHLYCRPGCSCRCGARFFWASLNASFGRGYRPQFFISSISPIKLTRHGHLRALPQPGLASADAQQRPSPAAHCSTCARTKFKIRSDDIQTIYVKKSTNARTLADRWRFCGYIK
jgi:hypothetical protein